MSVTGAAAIVVAVIATVVLVRLQQRHLAAVRRDRAAVFDSATDAIDDARVQHRGLDFPLLYGRFGERAVRVEPIVDSMSMRTVPVLRLVVTVRDHLPGQPLLSVLADETGQEFYADRRGLRRLRNPTWPARASVACADGDIRSEVVDTAVAAMSDPLLKHVLVTDRGVRCVVRVAQSDSATYRVTRRIDLSGVRVSASLLRHAAETAAAICDRAERCPTPDHAGLP